MTVPIVRLQEGSSCQTHVLLGPCRQGRAASQACSCECRGVYRAPSASVVCLWGPALRSSRSPVRLLPGFSQPRAHLRLHSFRSFLVGAPGGRLGRVRVSVESLARGSAGPFMSQPAVCLHVQDTCQGPSSGQSKIDAHLILGSLELALERLQPHPKGPSGSRRLVGVTSEPLETTLCVSTPPQSHLKCHVLVPCASRVWHTNLDGDLNGRCLPQSMLEF